MTNRRTSPLRTAGTSKRARGFALHILLLATTVVAATIITSLFTAVASADPVRGGTLRVGQRMLESGLDPHFMDARPSGRIFYNSIYENLMVMDHTGRIQPQLATSWDVDESGTVITFQLRDGVVFHDGTPFDAAAAAFSIDRAGQEGTRVAGDLALVDEIEALDRLTLRITLSEPSAAFLAQIANDAGFIVSPAAVERYGDDFRLHPVGTGPFQVVEWVHGDYVRLERFDAYWGEGADGEQLPYLDGIVIRTITDDATKFLTMRAGELEIVDVIDSRNIAIAEQDPTIVVDRAHAGQAYLLGFNVAPHAGDASPFVDNRLLRIAVAHAVDKEEMLNAVLLGEGEVTPTLLQRESWVFNSELEPYPYDPELAATMLSDAGYPDGLDVSLTIINRQPDVEMAEWVKFYLDEVGIRTEINAIDRLAWLDRTRGRLHQLSLSQFSQPRPDPDFTFRWSMHPDAGGNHSGWDDAYATGLIDEGLTQQNMDLRADIYHEIQRYYLEELPFLTLFQRVFYYGRGVGVEGVTFDGYGIVKFNEVWLNR